DRLEYSLGVPRSRCARRRRRPRRWPRPTAHHRREARIECLLDLLRADEMDMCVDPASGDDLAFAGNDFATRPNDYIHAGLDIGVACLADNSDTPVLDADIGFHDPPVIENERVCDDRINGTLLTGSLRLTHAVPNDFAATKPHFLAIDREISLYLD